MSIDQTLYLVCAAEIDFQPVVLHTFLCGRISEK